jgi:predicted nucleic acid-binding protein
VSSTALVVDASVAVEWLFDEPDSDLAKSLKDRRLLAPDLLLLECCSVIWRNLASGRLAPDAVPEALAILRTAPVRLRGPELLLDEILRYATLLRHPVYDCAYLALAVVNDLRVVTADRRFARAVKADDGLARHIVLLGDLAH